jgi:hypothetical protein
MNNQRYQRFTTWLLRIIGGSVCIAFIPIFFPLSWMEWLHSKASLGPLPTEPIFEYLARSTSAMYFAHGCVVLLASFDIRRYLPLVWLIGFLNLFCGAVLLGTDLLAPMPTLWTLFEGPPIMCGGVLLLWLTSQASRELQLEVVAENASA